MLLTFDEDGTVQFTRNPSALALVDGLGALNVTRMSEIKHDYLGQFFYIQFCTGEFESLVLRWEDAGLVRAKALLDKWLDFAEEHSPGMVAKHCSHGRTVTRIVQFPTYEDAVAIEVAFIDMLREQGVRVQ